MLRRKIMDDLIKWKNNKHNECLLVKGARQVGKTYIIEQFAKENYKNYIYINFELMPQYKSIFDGNLDIDTILLKLSTLITTPIVPDETLIFLDEIQSCPNARVALKSFAMDKKIDVIASGSLLGLYYKEIVSYPVGYEKVLHMYPLDFEEFLWAMNVDQKIIDICRDAFFNKKELDEFYLKLMNDHFKNYIICGGMPAVVKEFRDSKNIINFREKQRDLLNGYLLDVTKYSESNDKQKIINVFDSIPMQLAKKNKKFSYLDIVNNKNRDGERVYSSSIEWLNDAGIINFCYNINEPCMPLIANIRQNCFKIYMGDTGLLMASFEDGVTSAILNGDCLVNEGALLENVCSQELKTRYDKITYYEKKSQLEIDFVLNINGIITALEVKSGNNTKSKSLDSIIKNYKTVGRYIKLERNSNVYVDEKNIEHYPLFMIMFI